MVQITFMASALALASGVMSACNYGTTQFPREASVPIGKFGYTALDGPLNWFSLNKTANKMCSEGKHQSPININSTIHTGPANSTIKFTVDSYPGGAEFENLGTTLEVPANGTLIAGNKTYSLVQFHFHTPSEHRIDQEYYPMELHFVFQTKNASIAVVAFVIELGAADPLLASIFDYANGAALPGNSTMTGPLVFKDLEDHFHENKFYQYSGSLTTPPCSEGVQWYISALPLGIDTGTYHKVKHILKFNSRFTQDYPDGPNLLANSAQELASN